MKKLLLEVYRGKSLQVAESQGNVPDGMMRMVGTLGVVDSVNRNGRFYPKTEYGKHVKLMQERIERDNDVLGEMEHPKSMTIDYNNVSHKIEKVWLDEQSGHVMGQILLLDTPKGKIAQSIARSNSPLHISSRAIGSIGENGAVTLEELATYDLVGTPGFVQASMKVSESLDERGNVLTESYAFDIDDTGAIIEGSKLDGVIAVIESKIDKKINDAIENAKKSINENHKSAGLTKDEILDVVREYVSTTAAPDIQDYLRSEISEAVKKSNKTESLTRKDVIRIMNEQFVKVYAPVIEKWTVNEFAPVIEQWVIDEYSPTLEKWLAVEFAPIVEKWVVNEFAPVIESWITDEYSPVLEKWIVNEFAPKVQGWIIDEFAPTLEKWNNEKFAPKIQGWIIDEFSPALEKWIGKEITETLSNGKAQAKPVIESSKILNTIDKMIVDAKSAPDKKHVETAEEKKQRELNEHFKVGPAWLQMIPEKYKLIWLTLTEAKKQEIARQASVRVLNERQEIERFWNTRDFSISADPKKKINENVIVQQSAYKRNLVAMTQTLRA